MIYIKFQVYPIGNLEIKFEIGKDILNSLASSESQEKQTLEKGFIQKQTWGSNKITWLQSVIVSKIGWTMGGQKKITFLKFPPQLFKPKCRKKLFCHIFRQFSPSSFKNEVGWRRGTAMSRQTL